MNINIHSRFIAAAALMLVLSAPAWSVCNSNSTETGATSVVDLQGQGNFTCAQVASGATPCLNSSCTMAPAPGFTWGIGSTGARKYVNWSAPQQVDKIYVTASGNGSRCLYDFTPGAKTGSFLEPGGSASQTTVVACYDGREVPTPLPPKTPISTTSNCAAALPALQTALAADGNIITFIGIGTDQGLSGQGTSDKDYALAVCSAGAQVQCVDECRQPTTATYSCTPGAGELCLAQRACAISAETPTGNTNAPKYCWELSHKVKLATGTFTPVTELESGSAHWEQYKGSTCVKVTTTLRGTVYSYYTPAGCP